MFDLKPTVVHPTVPCWHLYRRAGSQEPGFSDGCSCSRYCTGRHFFTRVQTITFSFWKTGIDLEITATKVSVNRKVATK